jgi:hypothetical protein
MKLSKPRISSGRMFSIKKSGMLYELGNVYSYTYNPIHKNTLKFYDRNPLMLFMEYRPQHNLMFGVNLHYLPLDDREELVNVVMDNADNIQREFRWEEIYKEPRFRHLPIGFRQYNMSRVMNPTKIIDLNEDKDVDRNDLKFKRRSIISETGNTYTQVTAHKLSRMAKANKDWMYFLKNL